MGSSFLPQAVAECVAAVDPKRDAFDHEEWDDLWHEVLEYEDPDHPALALPRTVDGRPEILQADARQLFVYEFRDLTLGHLLQSTNRQVLNKRSDSPADRTTYEGLVAGSQVLEDWLEHTFQRTWPQAIPFRAALLRMQRRGREASQVEDLGYRLQLVETLRDHVDRERRRVSEGKEARGLYACLDWYADAGMGLGHYSEAVDAFLQARALADTGRVTLSAAGRIHLLGGLGRALHYQGRYSEAEPVLSEDLALSTQLYGPDHPLTLASLNDFALLLEARGELKEAESLFRRALEVQERTLGPEHRDTLALLNNLAQLLQGQGQLAEAEPLFRRALEVQERTLGPEHPGTPVKLNNLASLLQARGKLREAEPLSRRALEVSKRILGPEHPYTLTMLNNLARLLHDRGELETAEPLLRRALEVRERVLGSEHPDTLALLSNLASLLSQRGELEEAESLYRRAIEVSERVLGPEHPDTLISLNNLANQLYAQGEMEETEPLYRRVLEVSERVLGPDHPTTQAARSNLSTLLRGMCRSEDERIGADSPL